MTLRLAEAVTLTALLFLIARPVTVTALGSASTIAVSPSSATVCGVVAGESPRSIRCTHLNSTSSFPILPNASFQSLSGGTRFLCGLRSDGSRFFCWSSDKLIKKRVYSGPVIYSDLTVGVNQIAAVSASGVRFWRGDGSFPVTVPGAYRSLTSGDGFTCGIDGVTDSVRCWGRSGGRIETAFANTSMSYISAGGSHVCGIDAAGALLCGGENASGQSNAPAGSEFGLSGLALGADHTCAIRTSNRSVLCWGGAGTGGEFAPVNDTQFELLAAGGDITCGVTTLNFSVICWRADPSNLSVTVLPLPRVLPGICVEQEASNCSCGVFPNSASLCLGSGVICSACPPSSPSPSPKDPSPTPPSSKKSTSKLWLVFAIVGGVGVFVAVCTVIYCLWTRICRRKKVHNSVQPTIAAAAAGNGPSSPAVRRSPMTSPSGSRSRIFGRQGSRAMRRQRSGPSSSLKDPAEQFTLSELAVVTDNFAPENRIGAGSFGTVYKGKLPDGREVAIKRSELEPRKESAFRSELAFLSRLHHKHLVGLVGFCDDEEERLLVYEYMKNGALYDHLHSDGHEGSKVVSSWRARIKVLLDAARGIEYLHNYAVPPVIHRDIKSSNILLDAGWVGRVSDFGLSLMGPEREGEHLKAKAAGTVGYMDPEYYGLHHLTVKSDVYGLGVVMLEVLTGKRAIFRSGSPEGGGGPVSVVDYAVPSIVAGEVGRVLDERPGAARAGEAEAVELVAYTAVHCISLEGKDRPSIADIVSNLESALALCEEDSHGSNSSASFSLGSFD